MCNIQIRRFADSIYYLCSGQLAVYDSSVIELHRLVDDNYFGYVDPNDDTTLFRKQTIVSVEMSEVLILPLKTINEYCEKSKV